MLSVYGPTILRRDSFFLLCTVLSYFICLSFSDKNSRVDVDDEDGDNDDVGGHDDDTINNNSKLMTDKVVLCLSQ